MYLYMNCILNYFCAETTTIVNQSMKGIMRACAKRSKKKRRKTVI